MHRHWSTLAAGATMVLGALASVASTASAAPVVPHRTSVAAAPSSSLGGQTVTDCENYVKSRGGTVGPITRDACGKGAQGDRSYCESRLRNPGGLSAKEAETACDFALRR
jgi:hypothetical protein